ncbi:MAG: RDD family protein [bacterium]|nr:RDD family protein [bacterium]
MGFIKKFLADSQPERSEQFPRQIATTAKRYLAFMVDYTWIMLVLAGIYPFFLPNDWDLMGTQDLVVQLIPVYLIGLALFVLRDSIAGQSIGKAFLNLYVAKVDPNLVLADQSQRIKRNLFLILLPIEIVVMLLDDYARRLGDKYALTLVAEVVKPPKVRRVTHKALAAMTLVSALWSLYTFAQPISIKKSQGYLMASEALRQDRQLLAQIGELQEFTYWPDVTYAYDHITYGLTAVGTRGRQKAEVVLDIAQPLERPKIAEIRLVETPE